MKRAIFVFVLGAALIGVGAYQADATSGQVKVGYVDLQRTLSKTTAGKNAKRKLERDKTKSQATLTKLQDEVKALSGQLNSLKMSEAQRKAKMQILEKKYVQLQETFYKLQGELAREEAALVGKIFKKAAPVIQKVAKDKGFDLIVEKSAVLYSDPRLDITNEVNRRMK
mgnify:CR=1 FL=1